MPPLLLTDEDVRARLTAPAAVEAVKGALRAHHSGALAAPPRLTAELNARTEVITAGAVGDRLHGFRAYDTAGSEQLTAVWDSPSGELRLVVIGAELGARRTGALGAAAVDAAARPDASRLGLIGTGVQAWTQVWAISAVRLLEDVVVCGRDAERAGRFAARVRDELGVPARAVTADRAEEAVRGRDIVVAATSARTPVLEAEWVEPGTHVSTLGAKTAEAAELPAALPRERADVLLTDSPAQASASGAGALFPADRLIPLGAVAAGAAKARTDERQVTVFCSMGLAGTEVAVASALLRG